jgi:hypothetical protein
MQHLEVSGAVVLFPSDRTMALGSPPLLYLYLTHFC